MDPFTAIIYLIVSIAISIALAPKISPEAPSEDDIEFPTANESAKIPVVFGTVLIEGSNVIWGGDFNTKKIKKSGFLSSTTVGYKIFYGLAHAIAWGECNLIRVLFNDKIGLDRGLTNEVSPGVYIINQTSLFSRGGNSTISNGISGQFTFYKGNDEQVSNSYIESYQLTTIPAYKGLCYAVFGSLNTNVIEATGMFGSIVPRKFYWGNSTQISRVSFVISRFPSNLGQPQFSIVYNQANPIEIMYDMMTEKEKYGLAIPPEEIDIDNFKENAEILFNEDFGLGFVSRDSSFEDLKKDIERHCSCFFYRDSITSKWKVKLLRDDYIKSELPIFDENNISELLNVVKPQIDNLFNEIKVIYKDSRENFKKKTATAYNNAMFFNRNFNNSNTIEYLGINNLALANKVAQRDLEILGRPLISCRMKCNRDAFGLNLGDAIVVNFNQYEIYNRVFRVREIDFGEFNSNTMTLELIEDSFQFGRIVSDNSEETEWQPPVSETYENVDNLSLDAPYFFGNGNHLLVGLTKKTSFNDSFILKDADFTSSDNYLSNHDSEFVSEGTTPVSKTSTFLDYLTDTLTIENGILNYANELIELSNSTENGIKNFNNIMYIDSGEGTAGEFIGYKNIVLNTVNNKYELTELKRGLLDTLPKIHNIDSRVFFISHGYTISDMFNSLTNFAVRYIDINGLQSDAFFKENFQIGVRNKLPLNPNNIKINGEFYPESIGLTEDLSITYSNRDSTKKEILFFDETTNYQVEFGIAYRINIYNDLDVLIKSVSTTATSFVYDDEFSEFGFYHSFLKIEINATRGLVDSFEKFTHTIIRE